MDAPEVAETPAAAPLPGPPRRSLKKNIFSAIIGTGVMNACRFAVVVLLAKFASAEILGQYSYSQALSGPVIMFFAFHLRAAYVADAGGEYTFGAYLRLRLLGMWAAGVVLAGLLLREILSGSPLPYLIILGAVCVERIVWNTAELYWGVFQKRERLDLMAWSNFVRGVAMLLPFALIIPLFYVLIRWHFLPADYLAHGTALAVVLYVVGWWLVSVFYDLPRVRAVADLDMTWSWPAVRRLFVHTVPLGAIMLIINLSESIPRLLIENEPNGKAALGFFGAIANISMALNLVMSQAGQAAGHRLASNFQANIHAFVRLAGKLLGLAAGLGGSACLFAFFLGEWFLRVLYRPEYAAHYQEFIIVIVSQALLLFSSVFGIATSMMRRFWIQVPMQATILGATMIAAYSLIPGSPDPVRAAAWTTVVRAVAQVLLYGGQVVLVVGLRLRSDRAAARAMPPTTNPGKEQT